MPKLSSQLTEKELRKEVYRLRRELRSSVKEVRELSRTSTTIPTYAIDKLKELERSYRQKSVKRMTKPELVSNYRALEYIRGLKSSTVSGAIEVGRKFEPFKEELNKLSKSERDLFWDVYQRFYSETRGTAERFKYEVFDSGVLTSVVNRARAGYSASDIAGALLHAYQTSAVEYARKQNEIIRSIFEDGEVDVNNGTVLFSSALKEFL